MTGASVFRCCTRCQSPITMPLFELKGLSRVAAKVVCFLQPLPGCAQQNLIVPPKAGIYGNVTLKNCLVAWHEPPAPEIPRGLPA